MRQEGTQRVIPAATRTRRAAASGAPATVTLIAVAAAFYLFTSNGSGASVIDALIQDNRLVAAGEWWRIFTPVLLHANITHILVNMWALWVLGPQIERSVGVPAFLALYLAAAGMGGAFAFLIGRGGVGASGAIFGLFGIWANHAVRRRNTLQGRMMLRQIGFLLLLNAAIPIFIPIVSWEAHLGGLIAGYVIGEAWSRMSSRASTVQRVAAALAVGVVAVVAVIL
ncbi:MAG: rhomboid family intramembrane serine protease [Acidimicrobiia bacterium]|nr:rhomboid family intramembrane serine protease [Acidimicrobiia bacterium]